MDGPLVWMTMATLITADVFLKSCDARLVFLLTTLQNNFIEIDDSHGVREVKVREVDSGVYWICTICSSIFFIT